eukprot:scaffold16412_cov171-Amphora_coffeaeformis.AAC.12
MIEITQSSARYFLRSRRRGGTFSPRFSPQWILPPVAFVSLEIYEQKSVVLKHAGNALSKDGLVFGTNVTPVDRVPNLFAKGVLAFSHAPGALNNQQDRHTDMEEALDTLFYDYNIERIGCMSLWEARNPKSNPLLMILCASRVNYVTCFREKLIKSTD